MSILFRSQSGTENANQDTGSSTGTLGVPTRQHLRTSSFPIDHHCAEACAGSAAISSTMFCSDACSVGYRELIIDNAINQSNQAINGSVNAVLAWTATRLLATVPMQMQMGARPGTDVG